LFLGRLIIITYPPNPTPIERWTLYVGTAGAFAEGGSAQFAIALRNEIYLVEIFGKHF
jgi:hypothetical protein